MLRALVLPTVLAAVVTLPGRAQTAGGVPRRGAGQVQTSSSQGQAQTNPFSNSTSGTTDPFELTGHVINARTNAPIPRALVRLGTRAVMTNHDGVFSFPQVTSTTGFLAPSKQGFYVSPTGNTAYMHAQTFTPGTPMDLMLYPEAVISGVVASASGEGLSNFSVVLRRSTYDENGHHWTPSGTTQTDSSGMYRLVLPPGDYTVQTRSFGRPRGDSQVYLPVSVPADNNSIADALHVKMGEQVQVNLRPEARKGYAVSIASDSDAGRGFPQITAYNANGLAMPLTPMPERGEQNMFRVVLPNGTYRLVARIQARDSMSEGEAQVTVAGRDVTGVTIHYDPTPRLPVEVSVEPGVNIDNLTIPTARSLGLTLVSKAMNSDGAQQSYQVTTDPNKTDGFAVPHGRFQLRARSMGQWYVTGADYGGTNLMAEDLVTGPGAGGQALRIRISNQTASVTGTVTMGDQPVQASVYMVATMPSVMPVLLIRANMDGSFNRPYMAPGSYRMLATQQELAADPRDPATLTRFLGKVQTVTLDPGGKQTLTLEAVPATEMPQ